MYIVLHLFGHFGNALTALFYRGYLIFIVLAVSLRKYLLQIYRELAML